MAKDRKIQTWLPLLISILLIIGMAIGFQLFRQMEWRDRSGNSGRNSSVQQMLDLINLKYVDNISLDSLETAGINEISKHLDPHSFFMDSLELAISQEGMAGNFSGIGIEYYILYDSVMVVNVVEKGPANLSGILPGDAIIAVEGKSIAGINISGTTLRNLLRGKRGTEIDLTLSRNGKLFNKKIKRGDIPLPSVDAAYMIAEDVGFIHINRFSETTFFEFMDAVNALNKNGMKKMVLDLRGNGGGLLDEATKIADELLEDGATIVSIKGAKIKPKVVYATKPGIFEKGSLVALIDEYSASASEVLAGALQDNDRALVAGRRSFGKGLVQEQFNLSNGGALKLTVARYFTPLGRSIQKPYNQHFDTYAHEVVNRKQKDSIEKQADSTGKKIFMTRKGKKLIEGSGITPDLFIPSDSLNKSFKIQTLLSLNVISKWAFDLFRIQKDSIFNYQNPETFYQYYTITPDQWNYLSEKAMLDNIELNKFTTIEITFLKDEIKSEIVKIIWGRKALIKLQNQKDSTVIKSLEVIQSPNF